MANYEQGRQIIELYERVATLEDQVKALKAYIEKMNVEPQQRSRQDTKSFA